MDLDVLKVAVVPPICCWSGWKVAASVLSFDSEWENTPRETASRLEDDEQERQASNFCRMVWCNTCSRSDLTANSLLQWVCNAAWERPRFNETWLDIWRLEWAWIFSRPSYYFDIILQKQYPVVLLETLENHKCSQSFIRPIWLLHEANLVLQEVCSAAGNCRILPHEPVTFPLIVAAGVHSMTCDQMCIYASMLYRDSLGPAQTLQEWTVKGNKGPLKKTVMILFPHLPGFWQAPRPSILLALKLH